MAGLLVHEWFAHTGGSERVLEAMADAFPDAPIRVLWNEVPNNRFADRMTESWLGRTPLRRSKALSLTLMPLVWRSMRHTPIPDWVLVSSHAFAHHVPAPDIPKLVYTHSPARYVWAPDLDTRGDSALARLISRGIKPIDRRRAGEATSIASNSHYIRQRIAETWGSDATVIYPPVDVDRIQAVDDWAAQTSGLEQEILCKLPIQFILGASRMVPYKRLDEVIRAGEAIDLPVVLAGSGPDKQRLREMAERARVPVTFLPSPSDELLFALYERCAAYVFPPIEDFGIMPVEAAAAGARVLVSFEGGARESVERAHSGVVITERTAHGWRRAFDQVQSVDTELSKVAVRAFSRSRFIREIADWTASAAR